MIAAASSAPSSAPSMATAAWARMRDDRRARVGLGVIAMLWRRGGTASAIENVKWETVFGDDGLIAKIRKTKPRARIVPTSNSGTQQSSELNSDGSKIYGWSDPAGLPAGFLSQPKAAED